MLKCAFGDPGFKENMSSVSNLLTESTIVEKHTMGTMNTESEISIVEEGSLNRQFSHQDILLKGFIS